MEAAADDDALAQDAAHALVPSANEEARVVPPHTAPSYTANELELAKQYERDRDIPHDARCVVNRARYQVSINCDRQRHACIVEAQIAVKVAAKAVEAAQLTIKPQKPKEPHAPDLRYVNSPLVRKQLEEAHTAAKEQFAAAKRRYDEELYPAYRKLYKRLKTREAYVPQVKPQVKILEPPPPPQISWRERERREREHFERHIVQPKPQLPTPMAHAAQTLPRPLVRVILRVSATEETPAAISASVRPRYSSHEEYATALRLDLDACIGKSRYWKACKCSRCLKRPRCVTCDQVLDCKYMDVGNLSRSRWRKTCDAICAARMREEK